MLKCYFTNEIPNTSLDKFFIIIQQNNEKHDLILNLLCVKVYVLEEWLSLGRLASEKEILYRYIFLGIGDII